MRNLTTFVSVCLALGGATAAHAQFWKADAVLFSVNNNGQAAGINGNGYQMWTSGGGMVGIGGSTDAGTATISSDGRYVGGTALNPNTNLSEASIYDSVSGTWTNLGTLGSSSGSNASSGWNMTGDATTLVGNAWVDAGHAHAIRINNGTVTDLGTHFAGHSSRAQAISADGSVIGGWDEDTTGYWQGAVWINGVETRLFDQSSNMVGEVNAISGDGNWAFGGYDMNGNAYRWSPGTGIETFDNPFALPMEVTGSSYDGSVVVGYAGDYWDGYQSWMWTQGTGIVNLADYAAGLTGYTDTPFLGATGVSQDGQWIVGTYANFAGFVGGSYIIHREAVPEPCSLLALGGLGLFGLARRRAK